MKRDSNPPFRQRVVKILWGMLFGFGSILITFGSAYAKDYKVHKFASGLTLITANYTYTPLVYLHVQFKAGSNSESKETDGLTHLLEHMFYGRNALVADSKEFEKRMRELGMFHNNASVGQTSTNYFFAFPSYFLEESTEFASAIARSLDFSSEVVEKEIPVIIDEFNRFLLSPIMKKYYVYGHRFFGEKDHAHLPIGTTKKYILQANKEVLEKIKHQLFAPSNTNIYLIGDVSYENAVKVVEKYFGSWQDPVGWRPASVPKYSFPKESERWNFAHSRFTEATAVITYELATKEEKERYASAVLGLLLVHKNGTFYKTFVESGKYLSARLSADGDNFLPLLEISVSSKAVMIEQAIKDMIAEVPKWANDEDYFTQEQLDDVKKRISIATMSTNDNMLQFSDVLVESVLGYGPESYRNFLDRFSGVSLGDVRKLVKDHLLNKPYIMSVLYNDKQAKELSVDLNGDAYFEKHFAHAVKDHPVSPGSASKAESTTSH